MNILMSIAKLPASSSIISLLVTISTVFGCGVMPAGQVSTRNFTVTGFTLPVAMVYSTASDVPARVAGIAVNEGGAKGFVSRLVMQTVFDVLERQGRSALLPDAVISSILGQLEVNIAYEPLQCQEVILNLAMDKINELKLRPCIIVGSTVTGICTKAKGTKECDTTMMDAIVAIPSRHLTISGSLMTTNIIMANWSRMMWQSVMGRALQTLTTGPFGSHFFSASVTIGGN